MIITNSRYALVGYFITSYPTRAHGIIVKYTTDKNMKTAVWMSPVDHQLEIFTSSEYNLIAQKMIILGYQSKLSRCNMFDNLSILAQADAVKST